MSLTFKQKNELLNLISEYHWYKDYDTNKEYLIVCVDYYNVSDFIYFFRSYKSLFDDDGIDMKMFDYYISVPYFDEILDYIGLEEQEIKEMFEEEII